MTIVRTADAVEFYRHTAALIADVAVLDGRGNDAVGTPYVNARILEALDPNVDDTLVDVGCGNGCLLRIAQQHVRSCIGILPTEEEKRKLQAIYPHLNIRVGLVQSLPVETAYASLVVCNSVLLLLKSDVDVSQGLQEIERISRPGAKIWLGEIPTADEYPFFKNYRGTSVAGLLWHQLSNKGVRAFASTGRAVLGSMIGRETMLLNSSPMFYAAPEKFIALAAGCGLQHRWHGKHFRKDRSGKLIESPFRYNYLFTK